MLGYILDLAGVAVFAVSGTLNAGRKKMDLFGVLIIAAVTAIGGGTLRDVMLNRQPFWFRDTIYLYVIAAAVLVTIIYTHYFRPPKTSLLIADALGLAVFGVSGAQLAMRLELPVLIVVFVATISAVAGGILRDVLCSEIPLIFQQDLYMITVIAGAVTYVGLKTLGWDETLITYLAMLPVIGLRMAAIYFHWHLPQYIVKDPHQVRET